MTAQGQDPVTIAIIVGSVRRPRLGRVVADWVHSRAGLRPDMTLDFIDLADVDLPMRDMRSGSGIDSPLSARLHAADGFLVVTPEYNHSFPAALKNAIDWHLAEWARKPVAFVSYGAGSGGIRAVEQLRLVFAELSATTTRTAVVLSAPWERLDDDGTFAAPPGADDAANAMLDDLVWWATALRAARTARVPLTTGR
jgi:NAD(P)H-dependent FMN reductase